MSELTLNFDKDASKVLNDLMRQYNVKTKAELIKKALSALKMMAHVSQTGGELIVRNGSKEAKIIGY